MEALFGAFINEGAQGKVYHASEYYRNRLEKLTDGKYGSQFVVKMTNYSRGTLYVRQGDPLVDTLHILRIYEKVERYALPHVLPLVHWIVIFKEGDNIDSFYSKIEDIGNRVPKLLIMAFPLMESTVRKQMPRMNAEQRKDVCFQMIHIIQSLHNIGIVHADFHLDNLMYRRLDTGYYYIFLIDLDSADSPGYAILDYDALCDNIIRVINAKVPNRKLQSVLDEVLNSTVADSRLLEKLGRTLKETEITDSDIYHN